MGASPLSDGVLPRRARLIPLTCDLRVVARQVCLIVKPAKLELQPGVLFRRTATVLSLTTNAADEAHSVAIQKFAQPSLSCDEQCSITVIDLYVDIAYNKFSIGKPGTIDPDPSKP